MHPGCFIIYQCINRIETEDFEYRAEMIFSEADIRGHRACSRQPYIIRADSGFPAQGIFLSGNKQAVIDVSGARL